MKQLFIVPIWICLFSTNAFLQSSADFLEQFQVTSVYFFSPNFDSNSGDGWHHIKKDGQSQGFYSLNPLLTEAWRINRTKPVGYVSGNRIQLGGFITVQDCTGSLTGPFYVKAVASNGMSFPPQLGILQNGIIRYPKEFSDFEIPVETVKYYENFQIDWFVTKDFNALNPVLEPFVEWTSAGRSTNELMVSFKDPITSNNPFPGHVDLTEVHHTVLKNACKFSHNLTDELSIVDGIYTDLKTKMVFLANGQGPMQYWGGINPLASSCRGVEGLLETKDSACGEWSEYFRNMLLIQGITNTDMITMSQNQGVMPNQANLVSDIQSFFDEDPLDFNIFSYISDFSGTSVGSFFLVDKWQFSGSSKFGSSTNIVDYLI